MTLPRKLIPAVVAAVLISAPVYADVSINIGLPMPVVTLSAPPPMVWLPGPSLYVAFGSPQPIFFISGQYYLQNNGVWYAGPGYAGPWGLIKGRQVPPGLQKFRGEDDWRVYQHDAERQRGNGKTFQAKGGRSEYAGGNGAGNDHGGWGGNEGRGHGRGRGH